MTDNFIEYSPGVFARLSTVDSVPRVKDVPGAMITFMAMTVVQHDPAQSLTTFRDETLTVFGNANARFSEEKVANDRRSYEVVVVVEPDPANGKPTPTQPTATARARRTPRSAAAAPLPRSQRARPNGQRRPGI
jgi:hypothetical protein